MDWTPVNNVDGNSIYSMELGGRGDGFLIWKRMETESEGLAIFSSLLEFLNSITWLINMSVLFNGLRQDIRRAINPWEASIVA